MRCDPNHWFHASLEEPSQKASSTHGIVCLKKGFSHIPGAVSKITHKMTSPLQGKLRDTVLEVEEPSL